MVRAGVSAWRAFCKVRRDERQEAYLELADVSGSPLLCKMPPPTTPISSEKTRRRRGAVAGHHNYRHARGARNVAGDFTTFGTDDGSKAPSEAPRPLSNYLPLDDMPSNRKVPVLTPDEQAKLKQELAANSESSGDSRQGPKRQQVVSELVAKRSFLVIGLDQYR